MDSASALYESLSGGLADLERLVRERTREDIHLEFKLKKDPRTPDLSESDAWQFSRALSGFANSDGGVMIWGVRTDSEERAAELVPIASVADFEGRLKKSLLNSVVPFVDGVRIESVSATDGSGAGFAKVLIPRSDKVPHRAQLARREYYRRSAEGFYQMEHFDLEDAFGRRPHPVLTLSAQCRLTRDSEPREIVSFYLRNDGRGMARFISIVVEFDQGVRIVGASSEWRDDSAANGRPVATHTDNVGALHATEVISGIGSVAIRRPTLGTTLSLSARCNCQGMIERIQQLTLPPPGPL